MLTQLHKTKHDLQGRCYYLLRCEVCKATMEVRSDHIATKKHKCKPIHKTTLLSRDRNITDAPAFNITITAASKSELNRLIDRHSIKYEILQAK